MRAAPLIIGGCLIFAATARAEEPGLHRPAFEMDQAFFVPEMGSAWFASLGFEGRFSGLASESESPWPTRGLRLDAGWLRYFEGHGLFAAGPYAAFTRSVDDPLHPDVAFTHLAFGLLGRARLANARFFTVSFGLFAEVGPFFADAVAMPPPETPDGAGWRAAVGAEVAGVGLLWYLSPWLFGELVPWIGVEQITVGPSATQSLSGGLRLRIDLARRRDHVNDPTDRSFAP